MTPERSRQEGDKEAKKEPQVVTLKQGSIIYPAYDARGVLKTDVLARRLQGEIKGYPGFRSLYPFQTYLDRHARQYPSGTIFGTPLTSIKK